MRKVGVLIVLGVAVASCVTDKPVYTSDGRQGYAITCGGAVYGWSDCLERAGQKCGERGYDLYMRNAATGRVTSVNYTPGVGLQGFSGTTYSREMLIACRG